MKVIHIITALCLVTMFAGASVAQTDTSGSTDPTKDQMKQPTQAPQTQDMSAKTQQANCKISKATVTDGPASMPGSANVYVDGRFAMRIAASAGGMSPRQRADAIAERLNHAFGAGTSWKSTQVGMANGNWTVGLGGSVIATADSQSACMMRTSSARLANKWARQTVVAMGGQPRMIAAQLMPVRTRVAGSKQQLGSMTPGWSTADTKSVPLIDSVDGSPMGTVTVAGAKDKLDMVNSVMVYKTTTEEASTWSFVPTAQTAVACPPTRVHGVGLVGVPNELLPSSDYSMGSGVSQAIDRSGTQWNESIDSSLKEQNLQPMGTTKIVPIYSTDKHMVIGAAQIIGSSENVKEASDVYASSMNGAVQFTTSSVLPTAALSCPPAGMDNVLISSIVMIPKAAESAPATESTPGTTTTPSQ